MKLNKTCGQTCFLLIKDERTRDCMSREEMDAVLTSAIPYSWRLSERTPLFN